MSCKQNDIWEENKHELQQENDVCNECGGTREVTTMERVWPGEPHMAPIGTVPCPKCNRKEKDPDEQYETDRDNNL